MPGCPERRPESTLESTEALDNLALRQAGIINSPELIYVEAGSLCTMIEIFRQPANKINAYRFLICSGKQAHAPAATADG